MHKISKIGSFFNKYRLTSYSGKEIEEIDNGFVICSMYKKISSSKCSENLSIGFHGNITTRTRESNNKKETKGNYHVRNSLRHVFGFPEDQENATFVLGYKITF